MTVTQDDQSREGSTAQKVVYVLQEPEPATREDEINVEKLAGVIWRRKWWIAGWTGLLTALAVVYALVATEWYRAEAVLMPRDSRSGTGLAGQLAQFGGLADLAGLSLGQNSKQEPLGVLKSKGFVRRFIEQNDLVETLSDGAPARVLHSDDPGQDVGELVDNFVRSIMFVSDDKRTGLVTIAIEWQDGAIAADWANKLTWQVNEEMRLRALDEATRNMSYLREQLAATDTVSLQQAIARLLEGEMQKAMLAQGTSEFAFRVIDEAKAPARRSRPKRIVIVVLAFLAGLALSTVGALIADPVKEIIAKAKSEKQPPPAARA
jgi:uncharacterized protein involved in exopolysaccharide biosynthesis